MPNNGQGSSETSTRERKRKHMQEKRKSRAYLDAEAAKKRERYHADKERQREQAMAAGGGMGASPETWRGKTPMVVDPQLVTLARAVYEDYQRLMGWPQVPPAGLRVVVNPETVDVQRWEAAVVTLNEPQPTAGPSGVSVPSLVADPSLDLTDVGVRSRIFAAEVEWPAYQAAMQVQGDLLHRIRAEEFGPDAVPPSPPAGQEQYAHQAQYADPAQSAPEAGMFDGVDLDALAAHAVDPNTWDWQSVGMWPTSDNPVAPSALAHLPGVEGPTPAYGTAALSQGMNQLSLAAPDLYNPASGHPNVAYTQWDTTAFQRPNTGPNTQLVPQTSPYQPDQPPGRTRRSGRPPRQR